MSKSAEFKGPGVRHRGYDDSGDDFDIDMDQRTRGLGGGMGGRSGRIILLGDGSEMLTEDDEQEAIEQDEDDKDVEGRTTSGSSSTESRSEREATPGPEGAQKASGSSSKSPGTETTKIKAVAEKDTTIPEKVQTPDPSQIA